jgi:predicted PurR-regulated permease PerM
VPLLILVVGVARNADRLESLPQAIGQFTVPPPPDFVADIPLVGPKIAAAWTDFAAQGGEKLAATAQSHAAEATQWLVKRLGGFTRLLVQILLMIVIAAVLYARGEQAARGLLLFARRLGGERGENAVILAGQTVRAVALGVIVTAVAQTMLAGLGLFVAGVPLAGVLSGVVLVLCIAQIGPTFVLLPAVVWLYGRGDATWGTVLLIWSIAVIPLDNILRPILIKRGAPLPLLLVFAGVIGGLVSLGIIGIFVGPVVLAVANSLIRTWVGDGNGPAAQENAVPAAAEAAR